MTELDRKTIDAYRSGHITENNFRWFIVRYYRDKNITISWFEALDWAKENGWI